MTGRRRALDILPWMGIAGAAIGWGLSHQVGSNGIFDDCRADGELVLLVSAVGLILVLLGAVGSLSVVWGGSGPGGARRFVAWLGVLLAAVAMFAIALQIAAGLIIPECAI